MKISNTHLSDINWDVHAAWSWPRNIKCAVIVLSALFVSGVFFYCDTFNELNQLQMLQQKEIQLKTLFETNQKQSVDLSSYQMQLQSSQKRWQTMSALMSTEEDASSLLHTISQIGITHNIEFKSLQLMPKIPHDVLIALPIHIEIRGTYSELRSFIHQLEQLPTLITLHDFSIASLDTAPLSSASNELLMSLMINAYRQNDSDKTKKNANT